MSLERKIATFVLRHRWILLILISVGTAFLGWQFRHFRVAHDPLGQLPPDAPELRILREFESNFGQLDLVVVALESADAESGIFAESTLNTISTLTHRFKEMEGIESVVSLETAISEKAGEGIAENDSVLNRFARNEITLLQLREEVLSNPSWVGNIVAADGSTAAINLFLSDTLGDAAEHRNLMEEIRGVLDSESTTLLKPSLTGMSAIVLDVLEHLEQDVRFFLLITPLFMAALLFLLFRRLDAVLVPLVIIVVTVIWVLGLFFLGGNSLGMATTLLPTLISLIALSDVVHVLAHYYESDIPDKHERIILTMEHMIRACFMTSVTTAVGIGSLASSPVASIQEFGIWSAIGITVAYLLAIFLLPILLSLRPLPTQRQSRRGKDHWGRVLAKLESQWGRPIRLVTVAALILAGFFMTRVKIEARLVSLLPPEASSVEGLTIVDEKLSGSESIELMISADPGTFKKAWAIEEIESLHHFLEEIPGVNHVHSPASILRAVSRNYASLEKTDRTRSTSFTDNEIEDYLFSISVSAWEESLRTFLTEDNSTARISGRIRAGTTEKHLEYLRTIEQFAEANLDPRLHLETTGRMKMFATQIRAIVQSLLRSLCWTTILITLLLVLHFRSLKVAFVSLIPNILPVLVPLGVMGIFDIPLNAGTVMVSCIAIGLAVDNEIHFLARYRREISAGLEMDEALRNSLIHTGKAIVMVSIVIAGGVAVFLFSGFLPNRHFGILIVTAMLSAPVADLFLLPYLIRLIKLR